MVLGLLSEHHEHQPGLGPTAGHIHTLFIMTTLSMRNCIEPPLQFPRILGTRTNLTELALILPILMATTPMWLPPIHSLNVSMHCEITMLTGVVSS